MSDLLVDVILATTSAADPSLALARVAELLTRRADWVLADRLDDPDLVTRVAAYNQAGPLPLPAEVGNPSARRSAAGTVGLLNALIAAPGRALRLDRTALEALAQDADPRGAVQARGALALGCQELLLLGLVARDTMTGVLTLGSRRGFVHDDAAMAELAAIAQHTALVLDAARLLSSQRAVATAMQTSLLPAVPAVPGLRLAARYAPAAHELEVGGDWYDAFATAAGLVLVVGDTSGHDVAAAARMADLRNLLRAYAVDCAEPPSALVGRLDRTAQALGLDATATCVVARVAPLTGPGGPPDRHLLWTSAGHLPPILLRGSTATLLETTADLMLGVDPEAPRTDHALTLRPGDLLLLFTDGLVERRDTPLTDGLERLRHAVETHGGLEPDVLAERILGELGMDATDDVALLVLAVPPDA